MSETASHWLLLGMIAFATIFVIGGGMGMYFYRKFGYPTTPRFLKSIRLRDDIDTIYKKIAPALEEGFRVTERTDELLILEKSYDDPSCEMIIEIERPSGWCPWSMTFVRVKCPKHPWMSWKSSSGSNAYRRKRN